MSDLLVYVIVAVVAIAGAAAWLCFPKREPQARDGAGEPTPPPQPTRSLPAQRESRPVHHWLHIERGQRLRCHWTNVHVRSPEEPLTRRQG
jgi:hypothetical protein